ncbi:DUF4124 domain-containing protein [Leeia sp. TBRC 13508]|uniref:DUF4124 domain-containing protein n=1 Tax=Leeia speluncae TaxID=2884804 RepID=A0ABS8D7D1_9NEIS|nr:DUF4124 domain-containing protein [Leeia speluncae]MCB6184111.1 DUF4124 domain-containing protein [Leeia speluncae]
MKKLLLVGLLLSPAVMADTIYKVVDANGNVTYTNSPVKGAQRLNFDDAVAPNGFSSGGAAKPKREASSTATATPTSFPRVDTETQKRRDNTRAQVLQDELNDEVKLFEESRKALSDATAQKQPADKLAKLQNSVTLHSKNIEALRKELAGVKEF